MHFFNKRKMQFTNAYYVVNVAVIASYAAVRQMPSMTHSRYSHDLFYADVTGFTRETQIFGCLFVVCLSRFLSGRLVEEVLPLFFMLTKVSILISSFVVSFTVPLFYLVAFIAIWLTTQEPEYKGDTKVRVVHPEKYLETVAAHPRVLVMLGAGWSPPTRRFSKNFAMLSMSVTNAVFFRIDIGRCAYLAKQLNIDAGGSSRQIPTLILYEKGKEVKRMPSENTLTTKYVNEYSRDQIMSFFDLKQK